MTLIETPYQLVYTLIGVAVSWLFAMLNDMRKKSVAKRRDEVDKMAKLEKENYSHKAKIRKLEESLHLHRVRMINSKAFSEGDLPPFLPEDN